MSSKERFLQLVEDLPEDRADELLRLATNLYAVPRVGGARRRLSRSATAATAMSRRAEELLRDGFGG